MAIHNPVTPMSVDSNGDSQAPSSTNPIAVATQSSSVTAYGNYPETWWLDIAGTAGDTSTGTTIYESPDISHYNHHEVTVVAGTAADNVFALISHDGTNYEGIVVMWMVRSAATGPAAQVNDIKAANNYYLDGKFKKIKIYQVGASISAAYQVRGSHSVV